MSQTTRRSFLQKSAAAAGAIASLTIAGTKASGRVLGANDTIRVGVAGVGIRGTTHAQKFSAMKNVQVTYLIDPDSKRSTAMGKALKDKVGLQPKCVQDVREAIADKELDAITVATCNHWHSLITIWACQAEKDVYVEKPCSHNVFEGRKCVEAAKKYKRIVQHGTQQRSSARHAERAREIAEGKYGKLLVSCGTCYKRRPSIGVKDIETLPEGLNFDIWLGPAPQQPFHRNLVHYNWHWFWDTGNGDLGNQGVHEMDIARWMIPNATLPKSVISFGGRFGYKDQGQTPNTMVSLFDFGNALLLFEVRGLPTKGGVGNNQIFDDGAKVEPVKIARVEGVKSPTASRGPGDIWENFIACVRSRRQQDLDAHILEAHYSSALCHLGNISFRLGVETPLTETGKAFAGNPTATEAFQRMQEHLKDNDVELAGGKYIVGRHLQFDTAAEKFIGDDEANRLLRRVYRDPYIVPEAV